MSVNRAGDAGYQSTYHIITGIGYGFGDKITLILPVDFSLSSMFHTAHGDFLLGNRVLDYHGVS
jgi:hypothetical protein